MDITIDLTKLCRRCGHKGVVSKGKTCLGCLAKGVRRGDYDEFLSEEDKKERIERVTKRMN